MEKEERPLLKSQNYPQNKLYERISYIFYKFDYVQCILLGAIIQIKCPKSKGENRQQLQSENAPRKNFF